MGDGRRETGDGKLCGFARHTFFHNSRNEATVSPPTSTVAPTDDPRARVNLDHVRRYLASIEARDPFDVIATYFTPDVVQEEYPNRIVPQGATRDLEAMREGSERGRQLLSEERYQVLNEMALGDRVALEVRWIGTLAIPAGTLPIGGQIRARFGVFFDMRDGKIAAQRNYDCFDPF
jgi:ketosteroid isomerase-like protein